MLPSVFAIVEVENLPGIINFNDVPEGETTACAAVFHAERGAGLEAVLLAPRVEADGAMGEVRILCGQTGRHACLMPELKFPYESV